MRLLHYFTGLASAVCLLAASQSFADHWPKKMIVSVPVSDLQMKLYNEPDPTLSEERETQVLYGERLLAMEEQNGWVRVEALEQAVTGADGTVGGCEGWILGVHVKEVEDFNLPNLVVSQPSGELYLTVDQGGGFRKIRYGTYLEGERHTLGWWTVRQQDGTAAYISDDCITELNRLRALPMNGLRQSLVDQGMKFIDTPYLKGGRSFYDPHWTGQNTGVDAAGFIQLIHRAHGIQVPRALQDQYAACMRVSDDPVRGDLVFLSNPFSENVVHVMLVVHDDLLLEANADTGYVQAVSAIDRLGNLLHRFSNGVRTADGYAVSFGTFVH